MILGNRSSVNTRLALFISCIVCIVQAHPSLASDFRVPPYLQHPTSNGMTLIWFSNSDAPGQLEVHGPGAYQSGAAFESVPYHAIELSYPTWESNRFLAVKTSPCPTHDPPNNPSLFLPFAPSYPSYIRYANTTFLLNMHQLHPIATAFA